MTGFFIGVVLMIFGFRLLDINYNGKTKYRILYKEGMGKAYGQHGDFYIEVEKGGYVERFGMYQTLEGAKKCLKTIIDFHKKKEKIVYKN